MSGPASNASIQALRGFIEQHPRLFVITGAGCSTGSGIPDYRDRDGGWKRSPPVTYQAFMGSAAVRQRYWARSLLGWPRFRQARPNDAHRALAALEQAGGVEVLLTQNVDGLHQAAGSRRVIDLHGRLDAVLCTHCGHRLVREAFQRVLAGRNPDWAGLHAAPAPDGDADLYGIDFSRFKVPDCPRCGGVLKPDVVFFGESVPRARFIAASDHLARADAVLVVGSSLMVWSGFRFVHAAAARGLPVAAVNLGRTRGDGLLALKLTMPCDRALAFLLAPPENGATAPTTTSGVD